VELDRKGHQVFRRRRSADDEELDDVAADEQPDDLEAGDAAGSASAPATARPSGPWDVEDAPDDGVDRVDLGSMLVPIPPGVELRVDMQEQTVTSVQLLAGGSGMQLLAFAAPRSAGIWDDVRGEIADAIRSAGGMADEADGPFGRELRARAVPDQPGAALQPLRFVGVDGPRWFVRGLLSGPAATDPVQAGRLLDAFRGTVVVRGTEAMPPRDMLPMRLPREAMQQLPEPEEPQRPGLEILERGPEITETR
jgi:hypothetical protein